MSLIYQYIFTIILNRLFQWKYSPLHRDTQEVLHDKGHIVYPTSGGKRTNYT